MVTIRHRITGHTQEVTAEDWANIRRRSRFWEAIHTEQAKPPKSKKKAAEPEQPTAIEVAPEGEE